ncbi:MAG TPA: hypothetical protein VD932_04130 [Aquabacterium sp.]|nr:hypothetical protein [Aquabacterium sp.]
MGLPIVNARAAGVDIGARIQVAAVPPELCDEPVQTFCRGWSRTVPPCQAPRHP